MGINKEVKRPETYLGNIYGNEEYKDIITVEHRSNNPKRDFLFVNKKQCKHIPCSPSDMLSMCKSLVDEISENIDKDTKILVVGFAETATAIGHAVADMLPQCKYVMTTTREDIAESRELITFEEEHSHATTQKLLTWEKLTNEDIESVDYILFVEDEISTGKTILNFIKAFKKRFTKQFGFGVASVCNWQNIVDAENFYCSEIDTYALLRGELKSADIKMNIDTKDILDEKSIVEGLFNANKYTEVSSNSLGEVFKTNRLGRNTEFKQYTELYETYKNYVSSAETIRIIGTEECMYPAIKLGEAFEKEGHKVVCHATTRSKIDVLDCDDEVSTGIKCRTKLHSAYDTARETYLYNTNFATDCVLVVTDTTNNEALNEFMQDIVDIFGCKSDNIQLIRL